MHGTIYSDKSILGSTEDLLGLNRSKHLHRQLVKLEVDFSCNNRLKQAILLMFHSDLYCIKLSSSQVVDELTINLL